MRPLASTAPAPAVVAVVVATVVAVGALAGTLSCGPVEEERSPCTSPLDCELGEACRDGECVVDAAGEGEGEVAVDEATVVNTVCVRVAECQGSDPRECVSSVTASLDGMRAQGTPVCFAAVDASLDFFQCLSQLSCDQLNGGVDLNAVCPAGAQSQSLQNQCFSGEGEGEGEGERECVIDEDCVPGDTCIDGKCLPPPPDP